MLCVHSFQQLTARSLGAAVYTHDSPVTYHSDVTFASLAAVRGVPFYVDDADPRPKLSDAEPASGVSTG